MASFLPEFLFFHMTGMMEGALITLKLGMVSFGLRLLIGLVGAMTRL